MLTPTQAKIHDLVIEMERLAPLVEAERLADVAGIDNLWKGSAERLGAVTAERDWLVEQRTAEVFGEQVRQIQDLLERQSELTAQLGGVDVKIATFSEETRGFFRRANELMSWIDRAIGSRPAHFYPAATQRDAFGNVLDISPKDPRDPRHPLVPDAEWPAVQEIRELYIQRSGLGQQLSIIDSSLRDLTAKNPALALVKAREAVLA
jgi:hypothetical protein